jgi:hypothetical protein
MCAPGPDALQLLTCKHANNTLPRQRGNAYALDVLSSFAGLQPVPPSLQVYPIQGPVHCAVSVGTGHAAWCTRPLRLLALPPFAGGM